MMKKKIATADDVVSEIRNVRQQMWDDGGGTIEGYLELIEQEAKRLKSRSTANGKATSGRQPGKSGASIQRPARQTTKRKTARSGGRKKV